jgi:hypothetical protein
MEGAVRRELQKMVERRSKELEEEDKSQMAGGVDRALMQDIQGEDVKSTGWEENDVAGARPEFLLLPGLL